MDFSKAVNKLSFELSNLWANGNNNVLYSPISIFNSLNLIAYGAKNKTSEELQRILFGGMSLETLEQFFHLQDSIKQIHEIWKQKNDDYTLAVDNKLLVANVYEIKKEYEAIVKNIYNNSIEKVDFATDNEQVLKDCNEWVAKITNGEIKTIINALNEDTSLLILNAVYFAGKWESAFDQNETISHEFYCHNDVNKVKMVPMMSKRNAKCQLYSTFLDDHIIHMLELPYKGSLTFNILLPEDKERSHDVVNRIRYEDIDKKQLISDRVDILIPKFRLEKHYRLNEELQKLGIIDAFNRSADFSGISASGNLFVSRINHTAVIEVNEEGTIAAALTTTVCDGAQPRRHKFIADHPFSFFIEDKNCGVILFAGKVNNL